MTAAATLPLPQDPIQRALAALTRYAETLIDALYDALLPPAANAPPDPKAFDSFVRIAAAVRWLAALAITLDGSRAFLPTRRAADPAEQPEPPEAAEPPEPPEPPESPESATKPENPAHDGTPESTAELRRMRRVFATRPIGQIVRQLCARLGVDPSSALWPAALIALTQTPAEWVAQHAKLPSPRPKKKWPGQRPHSPQPTSDGARSPWHTPPDVPQPPVPPGCATPEPPPFHPRE